MHMRGSWSDEEDNKLRAYIQKYGHWNWRQLPKFAGLSRCGKSCRLRWMNYLRPGVKRGNYSKEEEHMIMKLHEELGNKWSAIAAHLPGRTDNEIKNFWHTHIKKRGKLNPTAEVTAQSDLSFKLLPNQKEQFEETSNSKANEQNIEQAHESDVSSDTTSLHISSGSMSTNLRSTNWDAEDGMAISSLESFAGPLGNFWSEPWSAIAAHLPGRTDNEIKNFWHTHIKKRGKLNPTAEVTAQSDLSFKLLPNQKEQFEETSNSKANEQNIEQAHESDVSSDTTSLHISSGSMSTNLRSTNWDAEDGMAISSLESFAGPLGNFWSEPFLENTFYYQNYYSSPSTEGGLMSPNLLYDDDAINLFHH
ncbi:unnamed protein product [Ilex paraguariensis]|uniref:Uncharacterized protein n=1 Tax=Ilex paraguariensis TaxID=185542 RepID=A0ABC8SWM8_9AQUA